MYRVFNMGIGLVLISSPEHVEGIIAQAHELGDRACRIGEIIHRNDKEPGVEYV